MSVAIIGGADGPTAIFVTNQLTPLGYIRVGVAVIAAIASVIVIIKRIRRKK